MAVFDLDVYVSLLDGKVERRGRVEADTLDEALRQARGLCPGLGIGEVLSVYPHGSPPPSTKQYEAALSRAGLGINLLSYTRRMLTDDQVDELRAASKRGSKPIALARRFGLTVQQVQRLLATRRPKRPPRR